MELLLDVEELLKVTIGASRERENRKPNEWKEQKKLEKRGGLEIILNVDETQLDIVRKLAFVTILCAKLRNNVKFEPQDGTTKLHTLATMFNMCVLQEEADDPTYFLSNSEATMDDATTITNCKVKIIIKVRKLR